MITDACWHCAGLVLRRTRACLLVWGCRPRRHLISARPTPCFGMSTETDSASTPVSVRSTSPQNKYNRTNTHKGTALNSKRGMLGNTQIADGKPEESVAAACFKGWCISCWVSETRASWFGLTGFCDGSVYSMDPSIQRRSRG